MAAGGPRLEALAHALRAERPHERRGHPRREVDRGLAYGNRIVIFREETVNLPANYSDIGHITFTDGQLDAKAIELFRELIDFGLVNITVGGG